MKEGQHIPARVLHPSGDRLGGGTVRCHGRIENLADSGEHFCVPCLGYDTEGVLGPVERPPNIWRVSRVIGDALPKGLQRSQHC